MPKYDNNNYTYVTTLGDGHGEAFETSASFTRLANATQYTANDLVSGSPAAVLSFTGMSASEGGGSLILNARMVSSASSATTGSFKLKLFSIAPTISASQDNLAFIPSDAEMLDWQGTINLDSAAVQGTANTTYQQATFRPMYAKCASGSTGLVGVLVDGSAYTPISGEILAMTLTGTKE